MASDRRRDLSTLADRWGRDHSRVWEPWLVTGEYVKKSDRAIVYELLALPLSSDGATVNMILGGIAQVPLDK